MAYIPTRDGISTPRNGFESTRDQDKSTIPFDVHQKWVVACVQLKDHIAELEAEILGLKKQLQQYESGLKLV